MSEITDAFDELLDAQEEATGERLKASVGAVVDKDAVIEELTFDEIVAAGGTAENGGFKLQMRKSDFPTRPPEFDAQGVKTTVVARGVTLQLLSVTENNGILLIGAGDSVAEDDEG